MMYVECYTELALVRVLTSFPRREILHEFKGRGGVAQLLRSRRGARALVDQDPQERMPAYLRTLQTRENLLEQGLRLLHDQSRDNSVVLLCPRFEDWIIRAANDARVALGGYGLPDDSHALHNVVNLDRSKIERLIRDLQGSDRLQALRRLLDR